MAETAKGVAITTIDGAMLPYTITTRSTIAAYGAFQDPDTDAAAISRWIYRRDGSNIAVAGTGFGLSRCASGCGGVRSSPQFLDSSKGGLNLFKWKHNSSTRASGWRTGDRFLNLRNLGSPRANWSQNFRRLRSEMRCGDPIYETYVDSAGNLIPTQGFLAAERATLSYRGWKYLPKERAWVPPKATKNN